jgi:hypothetical protein
MSEVKIVRLLGISDDLICEVQRNGGKYRLVNPTIVRIIPIEQEQPKSELDITQPQQKAKISFRIEMGPFLMPYMKNEPLECDKCQVVFVISPTDEMVDKYNSIFSPIIQPRLTATRQNVTL